MPTSAATAKPGPTPESASGPSNFASVAAQHVLSFARRAQMPARPARVPSARGSSADTVRENTEPGSRGEPPADSAATGKPRAAPKMSHCANLNFSGFAAQKSIHRLTQEAFFQSGPGCIVGALACLAFCFLLHNHKGGFQIFS